MLLFGFIILIATEITSSFGHKLEHSVCQSKECVKSASKLLYSINQNADPCDDFFKYACGNWAKHNPTSDALSWSSVRVEEQGIINRKLKDMLNSDNEKEDPLPLNQAKDMYKACINLTSDGKKTILDLLAKVEMPLIPAYFNKPKTQKIKFDWLNTVIKLKSKISLDVLIGFNLFYKKRFNATFVEFSQHNISEIKNTQKEKYLIIESVLELFKPIKSESVKEKIEASVEEYFELRDKIISSMNSTNSTDYGKFYTIQKLQDSTDQYLRTLNLTTVQVWKPYVSEMFKKRNVDFNFDKDNVFVSYGDFENLMTYISIVQNTTSTQLELFIWFEIITQLVHLATPELTKLHCKVYKTKRCTDTVEFCTIHTVSEMGLAVIYGALDESSSNISKRNVENMLKNIEKTYVKSIKAASWIKLDFKEQIIDKVMNTEEFIGFPDWLFTPGNLENYYKGLKMSPDNHLKNKIALERWRLDKSIADYSKSFIYDWNMITTIHSLNGKFNFHFNNMIIKTFMLDFPYYNLGVDSLNYAGVGYIMSHELMHSFDDEVAKVKEYNDATECIKEQYSKIFIQEIGAYANGDKSLLENIADIGGLKHAFIAYQNIKKVEMSLPGLSDFNGNKLFFLWFAHNWCHTDTAAYYNSKNNKEHSPGIVRIIGTLQNTPQFSDVWNCPIGSRMNPKKKCTLL